MAIETCCGRPCLTDPVRERMGFRHYINDEVQPKERAAYRQNSKNFMDSILILIMGFMTDRFGGAAMLFYGNIVYSVGSLLIAAAAHIRSYPFMIVGHIISSFGDVSTQVAQYQVFSSWFAPSNGFASTLGLELMVQKLGAHAGSETSNTISKVTFLAIRIPPRLLIHTSPEHWLFMGYTGSRSSSTSSQTSLVQAFTGSHINRLGNMATSGIRRLDQKWPKSPKGFDSSKFLSCPGHIGRFLPTPSSPPVPSWCSMQIRRSLPNSGSRLAR